jgi:hypothetical protein
MDTEKNINIIEPTDANSTASTSATTAVAAPSTAAATTTTENNNTYSTNDLPSEPLSTASTTVTPSPVVSTARRMSGLLLNALRRTSRSGTEESIVKPKPSEIAKNREANSWIRARKGANSNSANKSATTTTTTNTTNTDPTIKHAPAFSPVNINANKTTSTNAPEATMIPPLAPPKTTEPVIRNNVKTWRPKTTTSATPPKSTNSDKDKSTTSSTTSPPPPSTTNNNTNPVNNNNNSPTTITPETKTTTKTTTPTKSTTNNNNNDSSPVPIPIPTTTTTTTNDNTIPPSPSSATTTSPPVSPTSSANQLPTPSPPLQSPTSENNTTTTTNTTTPSPPTTTPITSTTATTTTIPNHRTSMTGAITGWMGRRRSMRPSVSELSTKDTESTNSGGNGGGPVDLGAVRSHLKKTPVGPSFHQRRTSAIEQRRSIALSENPIPEDDDTVSHSSGGGGGGPRRQGSGGGGGGDTTMTLNTLVEEEQQPIHETNDHVFGNDGRPQSLRGLDASIAAKMKSAKARLLSTIGDQIPACGRCGHPLDKHQKVTTSGMARYHEICPSKEEVASIIRHTRYFCRKLPERMVCAVEFDDVSSVINGIADPIVFSFIYDIDYTSWDEALSKANHDAISVEYIADVEQHAGIARTFYAEAFPPIATRTVDTRPREFHEFTFVDPRTGIENPALNSKMANGMLEVRKFCLTNGVLITLKSTYEVKEADVATDTDGYVRAVKLVIDMEMCLKPEDSGRQRMLSIAPESSSPLLTTSATTGNNKKSGGKRKPSVVVLSTSTSSPASLLSETNATNVILEE